MLDGLELPGDVWNLRFCETILPGKQATSVALRRWFEELRDEDVLPRGYRVEQLDVTFIYSPSIGDRRRERSCLFRRDSRAFELCLPRQGIGGPGKLCPVTELLTPA